MIELFKKTGYELGKPIAANVLKVNDISIQRYYDFYFELLKRNLSTIYPNEWILKQYIIYFLKAPVNRNYFIDNLSDSFHDCFTKFDTSYMILRCIDYDLFPFQI